MNDRLRRLLDALVEKSRPTGQVTLDEIGDALGTDAYNSVEIGWLLDALEERLRIVVSPAGNAAADLRKVLAAARVLTERSGRKPTTEELAAETGLTESAVRAALLLGRVMGR